MVMPLAGRMVAAVIGGLLVLVSVSSVTGTLIVSRPISSHLTRWVDQTIDHVLPDGRRREPLTTSGATGCSPRRRRRSC